MLERIEKAATKLQNGDIDGLKTILLVEQVNATNKGKKRIKQKNKQ